MSETLEAEIQTAAPEVKTVASFGKPERIANNPQQPKAVEEPAATAAPEGKAEGEGAAGAATTEPEKPSGEIVNPLSDEELKSEYEKRFPTQAQQTEEQKAAKDLEFEKRMLDLYVEKGFNGEEFYAIKKAASADLTELSKAQLTSELKAKGFSDEAITEMQVERYYQINPDELLQGDEEEDKEYEARKELVRQKVAYGTEKLNSYGAKVQKNAKDILNTLKEAVLESDLQKQKDAEFIAKIDEVSKSLPRKMNVQLGKLNDEDLGSVDADVSESDIAEIVAQLKDPEQRNKLLYTGESSTELNIDGIANLLLRNKSLEKIAREALLEGQTRQVEIFKKTFPVRNPNALGVGGSPVIPAKTGSGRQVASFGKSQRMGR
jgi:hypothetical protein